MQLSECKKKTAKKQMGMNKEEINRRAAEQAKKLLSKLKGNLEEKKGEKTNTIKMKRGKTDGWMLETQTS